MIKFLQEIWERITNFLFPDQYFAWQTVIYLALFSWAMSWVARFSGTTDATEFIITTGSWVFWMLGVAWALEANKIRPFGLPIAPWVAGAILCTYVFGLIPGNHIATAVVVWPLVSVGLVAVPAFVNWEFKPKLPMPLVRQQLILLLLMAVLFSSWFQFYFRLQSWLRDYPTLMSDSFSNSGFVTRLSSEEGRAGGIPLLTAVEDQVKQELQGTPWPWVERWLLNLDGQMQKIRQNTAGVLADSAEATLWDLQARPRSLDNDGYALEILALWRGPASTPEGFYLEKVCLIRPKAPPPQVSRATEGNAAPPAAEPTPLAQVTCNLETPKRAGPPDAIAS